MNPKIKKFIEENIDKTVRFCPKDNDTLIALPFKYTVPCVSEMFQELFYWDSYFTDKGLLIMGMTDLVKGNTDNMLYLIEKFGFMPNGNRTYFLNRSQPPYLSLMVKDLFEVTQDKEWLTGAYETLKKEYGFWQTKRMMKNGLNGYTNYETDILDDDIAPQFLRRTGCTLEGELTPEITEELCQAFSSVCESGWDCNSRVLAEGHYYNSVDLNSLLYAMEENMAYFAYILSNGDVNIWNNRKEERKAKMQLLWNEQEGVFIDYNVKSGKFSKYKSAACFYPLFIKIATKEQAEKTVKLLEKLELEYGVSSGEPNPKWNCQWDYPNVWAPMQYIVYRGLINYGYTEDARRIAQKYVSLIEKGFDETENLWEKYNGNTGKVTVYEYDAPPMMGWTAGIYIFFCKELGRIKKNNPKGVSIL